MPSKSLYVGNLPDGTSQEEVEGLFAEWAPTEVRLLRDRGIAFVDLPEENAEEAIAATNGKDFKGRVLTVNEARPRGEGRGGGRGGGRRREGGFGGRGGRRW